MDRDGGGGLSEADRWLEIAGKLLLAQDLVGSKRFAERAIDVNPLIDGADEIIAVADVLLASQNRINNHHDWYSILHLNPSDSPDLAAIKQSYRRLALLLHPSRNRHSAAEIAFRLVSDAGSVLTDSSKKQLYDDEIKIAAAHSGSNGLEKLPAPESFWTICPGCFKAYEYEKGYEGKILRCQSCQRGFIAAVLPSPPPIVPETDLYYCAWGLFPLGFQGCPQFNGVNIPDVVPRLPVSPPNPPPERNRNDSARPANRTVSANATATAADMSGTPVKRGRGRPPKSGGDGSQSRYMTRKKLALGKGAATGTHGVMEGSRYEEIGNANGSEHVGHGDVGGGFDMNSFRLDLDVTAQALGNLANLSFLKDDEVVIIQ